MINIATVGTSEITEQFLSACRYVGRYHFAAAYSREEKKAAAFAQKHGFEKWYTDVETLAADKGVTAVYIASPNKLHYEQSKFFLERGKHVLCEKPIVTKAEEFTELLALAESKGLIYMEAIMSRHCQARDALHKVIGQIGRISQARIDFCQRSSRYDRFMTGEHVNIFDMSLAAGTLMDLGVYCVYGAVDLFGKPKSIKASAAYLDNGADCAGTAIFDYGSFAAALTYSKIGQGSAGTEIIGDRGVVKIGSISQYGDIRLVKDGKEELIWKQPTRDEVMSGEAGRFADYIKHFETYREEFFEVCELTEQVHGCMDLIKENAEIKYQ